MDWRPRFTGSHLSYTSYFGYQCQAIVKVPGSFRPAARNEHLYSYCNFAGPVVETVGKSLRHSCRSEVTPEGLSQVSCRVTSDLHEWRKCLPGGSSRGPAKLQSDQTFWLPSAG